MAVLEKSNLRRAQSELDAKVDLHPYLGEWVALRDGVVIAHASTVEALLSQSKVDESDAIMPISPSRSGYFVA